MRLSTTRFILVCFTLLCFTSCRKPGEIDGPTGGPVTFGNKGQIYLSMNVIDTQLTYPFYGAYKPMRHATLCYDIEKNAPVWFRTDTMFVTSPFNWATSSFNYSGSQYHQNFKIGNELSRVVVYQEISPLGSPDHWVPQGHYTGIYLEKRDIHTGEVILMKKLLDASEFTQGVNSYHFVITNVINIGNKIYFGVNNGNLYCYDKDGFLLWKKTGYNPRISGTSPKMGYLYNNATKISYLSADGKLKMVDAATGNQLWAVNANPYHETYEILLTNKYVFVFDKYGIIRYHLSDGFTGLDDYIRTFPILSSQYPHIEIQPYSAIINDSTVCFWTNDENYLNIGSELAELNGVAQVDLPRFGKYLPAYPGSFFCVANDPATGIPKSLMRVDYTFPNRFIWNNQFTGHSLSNPITIWDIITANNKLYMVSNAELNGYNLVPWNYDKKFGNSLYLYTIDPGTGMISKAKMFSDPRYSLQDAFAITYGDR